MISSLKKMTPNWAKDKIKYLIDRLDWAMSYKKYPIVLENKFHIRFLLYPWNITFIRLAFSGHDCEKEFLAFNKLVKSGDIVFDVGANIGMMSVYLSRLTRENGQVYSFEPVQETYNMLLETLALNRCKNVKAHQLAISDVSGVSEIYKFDQRNHTLSSLGQVKISGSSPLSTESIKTETIDGFCRAHTINVIDMLKVDVEGFEDNVFRGAENLLKNHLIKYIQFEISSMPLASLGKSADDIFGILHSYQYDIYKFDLEKRCFIGPILNADSDFDNYYASQEDLTKL